jgi:hypothetical protein
LANDELVDAAVHELFGFIEIFTPCVIYTLLIWFSTYHGLTMNKQKFGKTRVFTLMDGTTVNTRTE